MRWVAVREAAAKGREAVGRFPFVILSGLVATIAAMVGVDAADERFWLRLTLAALLGLPLFFTLHLLDERRGGGDPLRRLLVAVGLIVPALFLAFSGGWSEPMLWTRFLHLEVLLHLCVAILPFLGRPAGLGFWQFNRILFLRFLIGGLFTGVLFGGLALALAALDPLFGIRVEDEIYARLFFALAFFVSPWFFAAGVPGDLPALDQRTDYPTGLRVFAQFILIPLVTVYLLILTAYLGRVLLTRTWPSGWIGWLVSGVAVTGTLALLLVHPLREREDSRWVDVYGRWFFAALLPSVVMLLLAIGQRIGQYGFTERRYFLLVLALLLGAIALYYAVTASRNIRVIPAVLAAAALLTFTGPWSAYAVSRASQLGRIEAVLERHDLLRDGQPQRAAEPLPFDDRRTLAGALRYLLGMHGEESLAGVLIGAEATVATAPLRRHEIDERARAILEPLGIGYVAPWADADVQRFYITTRTDSAEVSVRGYDWLVQGDLRKALSAPTAAGRFQLRPLPGIAFGFSVSLDGAELIRLDRSDALSAVIGEHVAMQGRSIPAAPLTFAEENERAAVWVRIEQLNGQRSSTGDSIYSAAALVLIHVK